MLKGKRGLVFCKEAGIREELNQTLLNARAFVYTAKKGEELQQALTEDHPHFVILDEKAAQANQFQILGQIRQHPSAGRIPLVVLVPSRTVSVCRPLIQKGVDRVLKSSIGNEMLGLEIQSLLRRAISFQQEDEILDFGGIQLISNLRHVLVAGRRVSLTKVEYRVLRELLGKKGEVVSRENLANHFLSLRNSNDRTLDVHINALRRKLKSFGSKIVTVRGRGYLFRID
jgi:DNA-binding response OmpR family regulator